MNLSQFGEFGLIDLISRKLAKTSKRVIIGVGDDCAVLKLKTQNSKLKTKEKLLLITTDTLIENVHFKIKKTSFFDLGYKALAVNISDIAAMGGVPTFAVVTIGAPKKFSVKKIEELYQGINKLAKKCQIDIVGGDTVRTPKELIVSITLLGEVEKEYLLTRSGARAGDLICVTGEFGGPAKNKFRITNADPATELRIGAERSRGAECRIRLKEARKIARARLATAMIDSSDGLVRSILEICKASKVEARIDLNKVPIAKGATLEQALYGGEEYELVFTVPKSKARGFKVVGEIVGKGQGNIQQLKGRGFDHFK
ncbi:thiamine-phosphate kinase [candidate division WOR-1 bacterium RIFCSPLOWO2_12_FULL_45_9]|uniref:Thiamine-monophosphate kinase n=1 Tax=candidate division WOR-1 bacterium RIFCSPLOWO2_12_FULL_45_9 TaxID=1802568 RepID=A0A1F4RJR0_UNCSA|nr:MAG: thiamine-phosphate kinase [candidate division WOR-1 bacterium RIFCSPLOWO2_12_FULL_45_9]